VYGSAGLGGGLVLSLIWMLVLRLFCGVMVWLTILLANLFFIACTIFSYAKAGDISASGKLGEVRPRPIQNFQTPSSCESRLLVVL